MGVVPPPALGSPNHSEPSPAHPKHLSATEQTSAAPALATHNNRNGPLPACVCLSPEATAQSRRRPSFRPWKGSSTSLCSGCSARIRLR
eukprot:8928338-Alexandrium_andersonii.AAC.1